MIIAISLLFPPHLKGRALHDVEHDRFEPVLIGARIPHNRANGGPVVRLDASSKREGQQFFGDRGHEAFRPREQRLLQSCDAFERGAVRQAARRVDRTTVPPP